MHRKPLAHSIACLSLFARGTGQATLSLEETKCTKTSILYLRLQYHLNSNIPRYIYKQTEESPYLFKRAGSQSRYNGQLMITDGGPFGSNKYYGRITADGSLSSGHVANSHIIPLLERLADNPAQVAGEYGRLTGRCCFCHLALNDPQSTAVGYGPICAKHYGLPHGKQAGTAHAEELDSYGMDSVTRGEIATGTQ